MKPILMGDYHTHSSFSGDSQTPLEENIITAIEKGLEEIAVTDHGIKHYANGMSKRKFFQQVELVNSLREKYPQIKILQSMEANLLNRKGQLDITPDILPHLDFIMMGFHMTSIPTSPWTFFTFNLPTMFRAYRPSRAKIEKNTTAYLRCMERYPLSFINHINYKMPVDIRPIAKMCRDTNTLIELNGKRVRLTEAEINILLEEEVNFITNSDAHIPEHIGVVDKPLDFIAQYSVPLDRVKNLNQLPKLKKPQ